MIALGRAQPRPESQRSASPRDSPGSPPARSCARAPRPPRIRRPPRRAGRRPGREAASRGDRDPRDRDPFRADHRPAAHGRGRPRAGSRRRRDRDRSCRSSSSSNLALLSETNSLLEQAPRQRVLEAIADSWQAARTAMAPRNATLTERASALESDIQRLATQREIWQRTGEEALAGKAPESVRERVAEHDRGDRCHAAEGRAPAGGRPRPPGPGGARARRDRPRPRPDRHLPQGGGRPALPARTAVRSGAPCRAAPRPGRRSPICVDDSRAGRGAAGRLPEAVPDALDRAARPLRGAGLAVPERARAQPPGERGGARAGAGRAGLPAAVLGGPGARADVDLLDLPGSAVRDEAAHGAARALPGAADRAPDGRSRAGSGAQRLRRLLRGRPPARRLLDLAARRAGAVPARDAGRDRADGVGAAAAPAGGRRAEPRAERRRCGRSGSRPGCCSRASRSRSRRERWATCSSRAWSAAAR